MENGEDLYINAYENSSDVYHVESVKVNGKETASYFINHDDIRDGGVVDFMMNR